MSLSTLVRSWSRRREHFADLVVRALDVAQFHTTSPPRFFEHGVLTLPASKSLWDILKREQIEGHDTQHVKDIWQEYHLDPAKNRVSTVLSAAKYRTFCETAALTPMFVLPVFRGPNSFETFALQCQPPLILFTSLEEFKQHGSSATPHMVVSHYRELEQSHNVVLVRGDILQPHALDPIQASSLMHNAHEYFTDFGAKREFVHVFNKRWVVDLSLSLSRLVSPRLVSPRLSLAVRACHSLARSLARSPDPNSLTSRSCSTVWATPRTG